MEVGTAQPTEAERDRVAHHLVGHIEPGNDYNVARFVDEANAILEAEQKRGKPLIIVGGTGLFLRHLIEGIFPGAPRDLEIRKRLEAEHEAIGHAAMREKLRIIDPKREAEISPNDAVRVIRALEVYEATGVPMSQHHERDLETRKSKPHRYFVINRPREILYSRIEARVDEMLSAGWLEEAESLLARNLPESTQAYRALGYRPLFQVIRGELSLEAATEEIKKRTRQFARRQLTWFRGVQSAEWLEIEEMARDEAVALLSSAVQGSS